MKLKYYFSPEGKKIYTMKGDMNGKPTLDAHYKFIKIRDVQPRDKE